MREKRLGKGWLNVGLFVSNWFGQSRAFHSRRAPLRWKEIHRQCRRRVDSVFLELELITRSDGLQK